MTVGEAGEMSADVTCARACFAAPVGIGSRGCALFTRVQYSYCVYAVRWMVGRCNFFLLRSVDSQGRYVYTVQYRTYKEMHGARSIDTCKVTHVLRSRIRGADGHRHAAVFCVDDFLRDAREDEGRKEGGGMRE